MSYTVVRVSGDYSFRNRAANTAMADVYLDFHFNSAAPAASYSLVEHKDTASQRCKSFANTLALDMAGTIGHHDGANVFSLSPGERGHVCIAGCKMDAVIIEPLFLSNRADSTWIKSPDNQYKLGVAIANAVKKAYPDGAKVAISIGHVGKTSNPYDKGAYSPYIGIYEAVLAAAVAKVVESQLTAAPSAPTPTLKYVRVACNVALRNGPSLLAIPVGSVPVGSTCIYLGENAAKTWTKLTYGTKTGWVMNKSAVTGRPIVVAA